MLWSVLAMTTVPNALNRYNARQKYKFFENDGVANGFYAHFLHATLIDLISNFWRDGVAPEAPIKAKVTLMMSARDFLSGACSEIIAGCR